MDKIEDNEAAPHSFVVRQPLTSYYLVISMEYSKWKPFA